jgi:RecA-family ATPase
VSEKTPEQIAEELLAEAGLSGGDSGGKANGEDINYSPRGPKLLSRRASDIPPEHIIWSWVGRLALGKHTCIAGEPGVGKSLISDYAAAAVTTGGHWPCGEGRATTIGSVIILSAEDGAADTMVPRLMAAGADLDRVHIVSAVSMLDGKGRRTFNLQTDITLLDEKIAEVGDVVLVIIDPISSYLGKSDSHKNAEVRGVLEPLSEMADRTKVAVLSITHFNKAISNVAKALHRFIGSIAFTGAPRMAFCVVEDPEDADRFLFLHAKNNLAAAPQGLAYRKEQTIVAGDIVACRVAWETEPVTITANQVLAAEAAGNEQRSAMAEAKEFLQDILASGPVPQKDIKADADGAGFSWATVRRAKDRLGSASRRRDSPRAKAEPVNGFGPCKMLKMLQGAHIKV